MILGIIAVIIFLSILILIHEWGHFIAARKFGLLVEEFGIGLPPRAWGKKIGETIYSVNWLPIGGFVKIFGEDMSKNKAPRAFASLPIWKRSMVIAAGVIMNFALGWILLSFVFMIGLPQALFITEVQTESPAEAAGLRAGDTIISIASGAATLDFSSGEHRINEFVEFANFHAGDEVMLVVGRGAGEETVVLVPRAAPGEGEGAIGIGLLESGAPGMGFFVSIWEGLKTSVSLVVAIFAVIGSLLAALFTGDRDVLETVAGPVGIVSVSAQASSVGFVYLLQLVGLISINLAVLNVLPFPALDGGRLFFLLIEKFKGSPLPIRFEQYANAAGMALLLLLMVLITVQDIGRFF